MNRDREIEDAHAALSEWVSQLQAARRTYDAAGMPDAKLDVAAPVEAARIVIAWHQQRLTELEPGPVECWEAIELTRARRVALAALADTGRGRRIELEITAGEPLAICTGGGGSRVPVASPFGTLFAPTVGCFRVFTEAGNSGGKRGTYLCPDCHCRRKPHRDALHKLEQRVTELVAARARAAQS